MLTKNFVASQLKNQSRIFYQFGSSEGPKRVPSKVDAPLYPNEATIEDLDSFRHIYPDDTNKPAKFSMTSILSCDWNVVTRNKNFLNIVSENFNLNKVQDSQDYFHPPRIHENSVFLYQSRNLSNKARAFRGSEAVFAFFIVGVMNNPIYSVPFLYAAYMMYGNALFYEASRRLVTRMDLLPHLEMVSMQKISAFGIPYNKLVRLSDLEKCDYEVEKEKENLFWMLQKSYMDTGMIFKDRSTGEFFLFDQKGFWDHEGINHALMN